MKRLFRFIRVRDITFKILWYKKIINTRTGNSGKHRKKTVKNIRKCLLFPFFFAIITKRE